MAKQKEESDCWEQRSHYAQAVFHFPAFLDYLGFWNSEDIDSLSCSLSFFKLKKAALAVRHIPETHKSLMTIRNDGLADLSSHLTPSAIFDYAKYTFPLSPAH